MPKRSGIKKVMVVGSGPIIIGQAAEFDYAGTQACKALKEDGLEVVLVNSKPATIYTLGGTGGGIVNNENELEDIVKKGCSLVG